MEISLANITRFLSSFLFLIIPALLFGIIFPLVYRIYYGTFKKVEAEESGRIFGKVNALNTLGSVLGPFVTGFILIALFQVSSTLRMISIINLLIGFIMLGYIYKTKGDSSSLAKVSAALAAFILLSAILPSQNKLGWAGSS